MESRKDSSSSRSSPGDDSEPNTSTSMTIISSSGTGLTQEEDYDNEQDVIDNDTTLLYAQRLLYLSHFFAQFSDGAWQFSLVLFLAAFTNYESLLLVSTYGLTSGGIVCAFGSLAGQFIDASNRLFATKCFIGAQNAFVLMATAMSYILLSRDYDDSSSSSSTTSPEDERDFDASSAESWLASRLRGVPIDTVSVLLLIGIHLFGSCAELLNKGFLVAMERDWIVVMSLSSSSEKTWLSNTNVMMKQIDLSCRIAAPAIAGMVIAALKDESSSNSSSHGKELRGAALLVGFLNSISLIVEYICTSYIYNSMPALAVKPPVNEKSKTVNSQMNSGVEFGRMQSSRCKIFGGFFRLPYGLKVYMDQSVSWGGIGFALLYLNALTFGALMTAYLLSRGMLLSTVGVWRGVSSAIGLLGTVVYHFSAKHLSVESTGMWSICFQFMWLSVAYASLYFDDYITSLTMLIAGVCASRIGLWVFDIAVTQIMQEYIPAPVRGLCGGVQQSLNAFFGLLTFVLGIFFPHPEEFHIYVLAGYASVGVALLMYTFSIFLRRDKLTRSLVPTIDTDDTDDV